MSFRICTQIFIILSGFIRFQHSCAPNPRSRRLPRACNAFDTIFHVSHLRSTGARIRVWNSVAKTVTKSKCRRKCIRIHSGLFVWEISAWNGSATSVWKQGCNSLAQNGCFLLLLPKGVGKRSFKARRFLRCCPRSEPITATTFGRY